MSDAQETGGTPEQGQSPGTGDRDGPARWGGRLRGTGSIGPLLILVLLAGALLVGGADAFDGLRLPSPDQSRVTEVRSALAGLPPRPLVLVGMDADLGTYPEIRVTLRAALDELLARDARLAFVSFTPEGRAVAAAELARLGAEGAREGQLLDLGFVAGAEAGMVLAVTELLPAGADGPAADAVREAGDGIRAFDLALLAGGVDLGPRSWVEQVGTRLPGLPMVAVTPTFLHPELAPYLRTGQLAALLGTLRDGAAYIDRVDTDLPTAAGTPSRAEALPNALAMLLGMLAALLVFGRAAFSAWRAAAPAPPPGEDAA